MFGWANAGNAATARATKPTVKASVSRVQMGLNCTKTSGKARAYAIQHHYCTADGRAVHPVTTGNAPKDIQFGDCGASWIYVDDVPGDSTSMQTYYGFGSILGTVVYRNLTIGWANFTANTTGTSSDSGLMFSNAYSNERTITTGTGDIFATESGTVRLIWGGQCTLLVPSDSTVVF